MVGDEVERPPRRSRDEAAALELTPRHALQHGIEPPVIGLEVAIRCAVAPAPEQLRDGHLRAISRACFGLVGVRGGALVLGPLVLLRFGEPHWIFECWSWSIAGGLLARRPGGRLLLGWREERLTSAVVGFSSILGDRFYRLLMEPIHRSVTLRALRILCRG